MDKAVFQERYRDYCTSLLGTANGEQFYLAFQGLDIENLKYNDYFFEDDKYWVGSTVKHVFAKTSAYYNYTSSKVDITLSHALYLHKYRDFAVLKSSIVNRGSTIFDNPIREVFSYNIQKAGFSKLEFEFKKERMFNNLITRNIKILIPSSANNEKFGLLLRIINTINDYIFDHNRSSSLDSFQTINENIKIEF